MTASLVITGFLPFMSTSNDLVAVPMSLVAVHLYVPLSPGAGLLTIKVDVSSVVWIST